MSDEQKNPIVLTIAGLDPSGGAGIIADIKTFTAFGCFATAAITSLTFQNTVGVFGAINQTAETVRGQVEPIFNDFEVSAVKTGMLPSREVIGEVARLNDKFEFQNLVVDPVVRSTSGFDLIDDKALQALIELLFPLACVVTPNLAEAERINDLKIESPDEMKLAAENIIKLGAKAVLMKGGHLWKLEGGKRKAEDILLDENGFTTFEADYIETTATHGTGCTLASAIAANLAHGKTLIESIESAKKFVTEAIRTAPAIGHGNSPINLIVNGEL